MVITIIDLPVTVKTECDLLDPSFIPVAAVARFMAP